MSLITNKKEAIGAFLHAFVLSPDALDAGLKVKYALEEDNYTDIRIDEIFESKNYIFEDEEYVDYEALKMEAIDTNEVVFGPFSIYDLEIE